MGIFENIISEQIIDANGFRRHGLEIPLRLESKEFKAILADTKSFSERILDRIESERKIVRIDPDPQIILDLNPDGALVVKIEGLHPWRFKQRQQPVAVGGQ